jgi:hypothetical protein
MSIALWRNQFSQWSSEYTHNKSVVMYGNPERPEELLSRNLVLRERIYHLLHEVSAHYTYFVLEEFAHTLEGCHRERRLATLRRDIEVWILHSKMPEY